MQIPRTALRINAALPESPSLRPRGPDGDLPLDARIRAESEKLLLGMDTVSLTPRLQLRATELRPRLPLVVRDDPRPDGATFAAPELAAGRAILRPRINPYGSETRPPALDPSVAPRRGEGARELPAPTHLEASPPAHLAATPPTPQMPSLLLDRPTSLEVVTEVVPDAGVRPPRRVTSPYHDPSGAPPGPRIGRLIVYGCVATLAACGLVAAILS